MSEWWRGAFQRTVVSPSNGDAMGARGACEQLLSLDHLPPEIIVQVRRNCAIHAPTMAEMGLVETDQQIAFPVRDGWSLLNPSIAVPPDGEGLMMIARSVNYSVTPEMEYSVSARDGIYRTENYLLRLSPAGEPRTIEPIDDLAIRPEEPAFPVAGFEDCRLVPYRGAWWAAATVRDRNRAGICQIALFRLDGTRATDLWLLSDPANGRHEKNWMPIIPGDDGELRFVYSCFPTTILRVDQVRGSVTPEVIQPASPIARHFSGGTQAIPLDGGHLCLIHEGIDFDDGSRIYLHRFVWFDAAWRLARLSPPFALRQQGIEFAAGLARLGERLAISYGLWDREARLAFVSLAGVRELLAPPLDSASVELEMRETTPAIHVSDAARDVPGLVSVTLAGNSRDIIGDALRSVVTWVDRCLIIDTGITDDTLEIARGVAGEKLAVQRFPWCNDFSAARNVSLQAAAEMGAAWAVILDTDERIDPGDIDVRATLAETAFDVLHVEQANGTYGKPRFFRLPARGAFAGPTHEAFIQEHGGSITLSGILFEELGKSPEQYRQKAERDIAILTRHTAEHPRDPRWFYYLGDSYAGLERHEEAVAAFRACADLNGWDEEAAWAMYRAAESLLRLGKPREAIAACAAGMAHHAGMAELPWLAGYAAWQAGLPAQAAYWARQSIAMGHFAGAGASVPRLGFRHPPALWEGPYDILRFALRGVGDDAGADEAERRYHQALQRREDGGDE